MSDAWRTWPAPYSVVRGESYYQQDLKRLAGPPRRRGYLVPVEATLRREPDNVHDVNAVRVEIGGDLVGYVARELALELAPVLDDLQCPELVLAALVRGGYRHQEDFGVMLWPERRLTQAPPMRFGRRWRVPGWPPDVVEGTRGSRPN